MQVQLGYLYAGIYFAIGCGFVMAALVTANLLNALFLKRHPAKLSLKRKRFKAALDDTFLAELFAHI